MKTDFTSSQNTRLLYMSILGSVIGLSAGIISFMLYHLIGLFTNLSFYHRFSFEFVSPQYNTLGAAAILVPVVGGLIVGLMAKYGTAKIKGHGIPEAIEAVVSNKSKISGKVAILKPLSAAIAIGTGGPFGAEGPIIQTGGAIGSLFGQFIPTTASERKILLACGAGAGMAATFSTPIAGVILAIELLLFEFKPRSFIPLVIASATATGTRFELLGTSPMFRVALLNFDVVHNVVYFIVLGILCGLAAIVFTRALYWTEDQFEKLPFNSMWWPAIGALALGVIGFFIPKVFGVGYDTISDILNNNIALNVLLLLLVFKSVALLVSLGSGTSGGLLAPMFMASAAMGSAFAILMNHLIPGANLSPGGFALVAMGAVFGAAARSTFAFIVFSFEITRNFDAILPLMLVGVIASGIALSFLKNSIMTEKLARRGLHVYQEYDTDILKLTRVKDVMDGNPAVIYSNERISDLAEKIFGNGLKQNLHRALPVIAENGNLVGIVSRDELTKAFERNQLDKTVMEIAITDLTVTYPDETLFDAVSRMLKQDVGRLLVVEKGNPSKLVGYLGRANILSSRLKQIEDEFVYEKNSRFLGRKNKPNTVERI